MRYAPHSVTSLRCSSLTHLNSNVIREHAKYLHTFNKVALQPMVEFRHSIANIKCRFQFYFILKIMVIFHEDINARFFTSLLTNSTVITCSLILIVQLSNTLCRFIITGRRTRNAEKKNANLVHDDTASPKRKDIKYTHEDSNNPVANIEQRNNTSVCDEPMKLRGGRVKMADISKYLEKKNDSNITEKSITLVQSKSNLDITDENVCEIVEAQLLEASISFSDATLTRNNFVDPKKSKNNNIFLQEPVLHLNFAKISNPSSRTLSMVQNSILTQQDVKTGLFTTPSQPKINSFWKEVTLTRNIKGTNDEKERSSMSNNEQHILDLSKPTQVTQIDSTTTAENVSTDDDNSCDSGDSGVILSGTNGTITMSLTNNQTNLSACAEQIGEAENRKKPATPHRILCPSPTKNAIIYLQSPPGLLNNSSSGKSRNKRQAGNNKTRKRYLEICFKLVLINNPETFFHLKT